MERIIGRSCLKDTACEASLSFNISMVDSFVRHAVFRLHHSFSL